FSFLYMFSFMLFFICFFFFFSSRRRHTRFKCDWSSDVCSSDLQPLLLAVRQAAGELAPDVLQPHRLQHLVDLLSLAPRAAPEQRSEERRVGKECRSRWGREHEKKNRTK